MVTARDIITLVLQDAGIYGTGQAIPGTAINNSLTRLNDMIAQWQQNRWLVYVLRDTAFAMTGALSYTVGTGQNFNCPRPNRLEGAYVRQTTPPTALQPDRPLTLVQSREAYSHIVLKQLGSFPTHIFYESTYPIGKVYPWPLPSNLYEVHILTREALQTFALGDNFQMPDEYREAIRYNLQKRELAAARLPADDTINALAKSGINVIRNANAQLATLRMPDELVRPGFYNVYTDNQQ